MRFLPQNCHRPLPLSCNTHSPAHQQPKAEKQPGEKSSYVTVHITTKSRKHLKKKKKRHKPGLSGWGSALKPAAGVQERQSWSCHDPPGSAKSPLPFCWHLLTHNCTLGQMKDLPKDPSVKTASTIEDRYRQEKKNVPFFLLFSPVYAESLCLSIYHYKTLLFSTV